MIPAWHNLFGPFGALLAADDDGGGLVNVIVVALMIIFGLIGHFIKKAQEKKQVEQADSKVTEAKRRHALQVAAGLQKADSASQAALPRRSPPPPPRQLVAGMKQQSAGADLAEGVREEIRKVRRHLTAEQADRSRRLSRVEGLKSGIGSEPAPDEAPAGETPKIRLNLSSPKAARTAIICAEILGLPKALRSAPEPWEL